LCEEFAFIEDAVLIGLGQGRKNLLKFVSNYSTAEIDKRDNNLFIAWVNKVINAGGISFFPLVM